MKLIAEVEKVGSVTLDDHGLSVHYDHDGFKIDMNMSTEELQYYRDVLNGDIPTKIFPPAVTTRFNNAKNYDC